MTPGENDVATTNPTLGAVPDGCEQVPVAVRSPEGARSYGTSLVPTRSGLPGPARSAMVPEVLSEQRLQAAGPLQVAIDTHEHGRDALTDLGNSRRFARRYGEVVRYVHSTEQFYFWDGGVWVEDTTRQVMQLVKEFVLDDCERAADAVTNAPRGTNQEHDAMAVLKHCHRSQSKPRLDAVLELAKSEAPLPAKFEDFDVNPWFLNCSNGTVDLRGGSLMPHDRARLQRKAVRIPYDGQAECPLWLSFLDEVMGKDTALVNYLQRAVGYTLTGLTKEQVFFFLHGTGSNGKSTFLNIIRAILGDYARDTNPSTFLERGRNSIRDDLVRLQGARFVTCAETDAGERLSQALLKQVTGGEPITARALFSSHVEFTPQFKVWMASNHRPEITGVDEGIWRRVRLIPFEVTIPAAQRDLDLEHKLRAELPGILVWAVQGCLQWQEHGLSSPPAVELATLDYRAEEDELADFLLAAIADDVDGTIPKMVMYSVYVRWCEQSAVFKLPKRKFTESLKQRGWKDSRKSSERYWRGHRLRP